MLGKALNGSRNLEFGSMHAASFREDAKHVGFVLRRYHFVAECCKAGRVLEVDAAMVRGPIARRCQGIDRHRLRRDCAGYVWDILYGPYPAADDLDGVYAIDVLEHIPPDREDWAAAQYEVAVEATRQADHWHAVTRIADARSSLSRLHHVNTKTEDELVETMSRHFNTVYILGLNDYTLHDGFGPMCHYRFALCSGKR
jgi:hypothetical protein